MLEIEFVETSVFTRTLGDYLDDDEYRLLQQSLAAQPDAGDIIPQSGGIRKIRWRAKGKGKRGGVRVIYFWKKSDHEIWLLSIYAKNEVENLPTALFRKLLEEFE
jgi:hypothetical protein